MSFWICQKNLFDLVCDELGTGKTALISFAFFAAPFPPPSPIILLNEGGLCWWLELTGTCLQKQDLEAKNHDAL
ncbi:hypothetical protein XENTR_v10006319 [Xenopus tropicalis]|nr:hypothetical protein XENTR_v10006319 [Xenopus tropicalis]